jgi:hypothetical protein
VLLEKLEDAVRSGSRVVAEYLNSESEAHIIRDNAK